MFVNPPSDRIVSWEQGRGKVESIPLESRFLCGYYLGVQTTTRAVIGKRATLHHPSTLITSFGVVSYHASLIRRLAWHS